VETLRLEIIEPDGKARDQSAEQMGAQASDLPIESLKSLVYSRLHVEKEPPVQTSGLVWLACFTQPLNQGIRLSV